jgi:hypothetical protein
MAGRPFSGRLLRRAREQAGLDELTAATRLGVFLHDVQEDEVAGGSQEPRSRILAYAALYRVDPMEFYSRPPVGQENVHSSLGDGGVSRAYGHGRAQSISGYGVNFIGSAVRR